MVTFRSYLGIGVGVFEMPWRFRQIKKSDFWHFRQTGIALYIIVQSGMTSLLDMCYL